MPTGTSGSVLVVIVGPPVPCRDYDRRYHLRPGTVIQAYRKLTKKPRMYGGAGCLAEIQTSSLRFYRENRQARERRAKGRLSDAVSRPVGGVVSSILWMIVGENSTSNNRVDPVKRRTSHRSGYTLHDSAGGPAAGPARPIILSPAEKAPRRPATTHQEAVAGQKQPGWDEPEEKL